MSLKSNNNSVFQGKVSWQTFSPRVYKPPGPPLIFTFFLTLIPISIPILIPSNIRNLFKWKGWLKKVKRMTEKSYLRSHLSYPSKRFFFDQQAVKTAIYYRTCTEFWSTCTHRYQELDISYVESWLNTTILISLQVSLLERTAWTLVIHNDFGQQYVQTRSQGKLVWSPGRFSSKCRKGHTHKGNGALGKRLYYT